ncbi:uncharacterized protein TNCV_887871 [Trichonephila clavipes]|nr:uncharacterized protein TNCV_887871 [Trichonephila clavipes]
MAHSATEELMLEKSVGAETSSRCCGVEDPGSNPEEGRDVCKCIVPSQHGGTLNNRRATSPLVRLVEGDRRWVAPGHPQGALPQNCGGTEQN